MRRARQELQNPRFLHENGRSRSNLPSGNRSEQNQIPNAASQAGAEFLPHESRYRMRVSLAVRQKTSKIFLDRLMKQILARQAVFTPNTWRTYCSLCNLWLCKAHAWFLMQLELWSKEFSALCLSHEKKSTCSKRMAGSGALGKKNYSTNSARIFAVISHSFV